MKKCTGKPAPIPPFAVLPSYESPVKGFSRTVQTSSQACASFHTALKNAEISASNRSTCNTVRRRERDKSGPDSKQDDPGQQRQRQLPGHHRPKLQQGAW